MAAAGEVTILLERLRQGDRDALQSLVAVVYQELRRIAAAQMRIERAEHTLQPTALVHEAFLRLVGSQDLSFDARAHFFAAAARVMRQILVDHSRTRAAQKRGQGKLTALTTGHATTIPQRPDSFADLHVALDRLAGSEPRLAQLIEMRFFGGMTAEESAAVLGLSVHVARHELRLAQAWLKRELTQ